MANSLLKSL
jgi:hypothetical protein